MDINEFEFKTWQFAFCELTCRYKLKLIRDVRWVVVGCREMLIASRAVRSLGSPRRSIWSEIMSILNWNSLDSTPLIERGLKWAPEESLLQVAECYHSLQEACRLISRGSHSVAVAVHLEGYAGGRAISQAFCCIFLMLLTHPSGVRIASANKKWRAAWIL